MIFEASPLWLFLCSTRQHAAVCYRVSSQLLRTAAPLAASSESEYKPRTVTQPQPHQVDRGPALGVEGEVNRWTGKFLLCPKVIIIERWCLEYTLKIRRRSGVLRIEVNVMWLQTLLKTTDTGIDKHLQSKCCGSGFYQKTKKWNWQRSCQATPTLSILEHSTVCLRTGKTSFEEGLKTNGQLPKSLNIFLHFHNNFPEPIWILSYVHQSHPVLTIGTLRRAERGQELEKPDQIVR